MRAFLGSSVPSKPVGMKHIRESIEAREAQVLSPYAALARDSAGRKVAEEMDPIRTCFQRDRDRILHSKPFRRLKHKTQVFIAPAGDHYRTRLTHTLEVAQVARTIGRALRLNEDLIEAIALGHDVGHPPFGHAGEQALDEAVAEHFKKTGEGPSRFRHFEQSLRCLRDLEQLNLTTEVEQGIDGHSKGERDLTDADGEVVSTLEAAVVRISDRIAYLNHDLDDALRSGIMLAIPTQFERLGATHGKRVSHMVFDVVQHSLDQPRISLSKELQTQLNELKDWLFQNVYYLYPKMVPEIDKAKKLVIELYSHYLDSNYLPAPFVGAQGALDYVSGMTDRFAILDFERLRLPEGFIEGHLKQS